VRSRRSRGGRVRPRACLVVETELIRAWLAGGMADFDACLRLPTAHCQITIFRKDPGLLSLI